MKKLIVAVAAAMFGIAANAAAVTWSITNMQVAETPAGSALSAGYLVQVFDAATVYDFDAALAGTLTPVSYSYTTGDATSLKATEKTGDLYAAGQTASLYAVIYDAATIADAKYYMVSDSASKTIAANGADAILSFGSMKSTATSNKFLNSQWTETVPEPTSGLLLLLGMAGLALKRKHA